MQESQPLGRDFLGKKIDARRVAARPGETGDQTKLDRVFADAEDDRDRHSRSFGRLGSKVAAGRGDNGDATADEVGHERRQTTVLAVQPMVLDRHILTPDEAGFVEALIERRGTARINRQAADESDNRHRRLLRTRSQRPRHRRAAEERDEPASLHRCNHSITSSAMASRPGGKLRPNALAVLRLITNSNLLDCMTGRSAGFSPLRIRPVYTPAWRYASVMLVP